MTLKTSLQTNVKVICGASRECALSHPITCISKTCEVLDGHRKLVRTCVWPGEITDVITDVITGVIRDTQGNGDALILDCRGGS